MVLKTCPVEVDVVVDQSLVREKDEPIYWNDLSKLKRETGFVQKIPLEKTVEDMIKWWVDNLKESRGLGQCL
jgi:GDPmannose 4,6-dehydratase/GDP-4-dehydro-6-deoxy-D-mannose reductase